MDFTIKFLASREGTRLRMNIISKTLIALYLLCPWHTWGTENESTYFCVSEESTGFQYKAGKWSRANFEVSNDKFIIRKIKPGELYFKDKTHPYGMFPLGKKAPYLRCLAPTKASGIIRCPAGIGELFFSPESGRFLRTYTAGYWTGTDSDGDTPHITMGRCSKI